MTPRKFFSQVSKTNSGCWIWTGNIRVDGYGRFTENGKAFTVHRFALEIALGRSLRKGECACHECDNRKCVRVGTGHIFLGTQKDNIVDAMKKGRMNIQKPGAQQQMCRVKGIKHHNAKLTPDIVRQARQLRKEGWTQQSIADKFGVRQCTMYSVLIGNTWNHVQ